SKGQRKGRSPPAENEASSPRSRTLHAAAERLARLQLGARSAPATGERCETLLHALFAVFRTGRVRRRAARVHAIIEGTLLERIAGVVVGLAVARALVAELARRGLAVRGAGLRR